METFLNPLIQTLQSTSSLEAIAMFLSILYLLLAIKQNVWCFVAAFFSTLIYTIIFFDASLLMDSFLNAYYLIMAIYGWYSWKYTNSNKKAELKISTLGINKNIKAIFLLTTLSLVLGYYMKNYTNADYAYLDTFTTVFAIFNTYLLAKKVIENWLYWIVIDAISIYIYINKAFYLTAILFTIYTILAIVAFIKWKKDYEN
ncbi:nicotinamide mononucleotide transporter [Malaciobacter halophilus]|uniref:Nicotinamide riboside transporter PnuC n=1 Tax=Malaciobacter halophilus TaxID=197482 RepID=A0A2N1J5V0_9BACT|nr:nicotinamide riboside transporter PnuC [Malaciobacter halophilus]AXH09289.1 nicotinamide mononucleotide transporter [Malaciobacter halophilus]PKI81923.1 nicotinamide mononucleotide transporter [Malaciobacter halophilus]